MVTELSHESWFLENSKTELMSIRVFYQKYPEIRTWIHIWIHIIKYYWAIYWIIDIPFLTPPELFVSRKGIGVLEKQGQQTTQVTLVMSCPPKLGDFLCVASCRPRPRMLRMATPRERAAKWIYPRWHRCKLRWMLVGFLWGIHPGMVLT